MKIIAQKSNTLNTNDFFSNGLAKDFINAMSFNVTYTKDNKIVVFNTTSMDIPVTNTINSSTLAELQGYEIILLEDVFKDLQKRPTKKPLYINLIPSSPFTLNDQNIEAITKQLNNYVIELDRIIKNYQDFSIRVHSMNRNLLTILKKQITTIKVGFVITGADFNFIDVDYYVLLANSHNDAIIDMLLNNKKEVIIYIYSDYHISFLYEHYLGEKSTPHLQQTFQQLSIMTNYPEIVYKVFGQ